MKLDKNLNILIIGLGLLGGSYAKALSRQGYRVNAITLSKEDIDYALSENMITYGTTEVNKDLIKSADLIIYVGSSSNDMLVINAEKSTQSQ